MHLAIIKQHTTSMLHKINPGKYRVHFIMFKIMLIDVWDCFVPIFILLLIDDWRLTMQVNICQRFFRQSFAAAFSPNFTANVFYHMVLDKIFQFSWHLTKVQCYYNHTNPFSQFYCVKSILRWVLEICKFWMPFLGQFLLLSNIVLNDNGGC